MKSFLKKAALISLFFAAITHNSSAIVTNILRQAAAGAGITITTNATTWTFATTEASPTDRIFTNVTIYVGVTNIGLLIITDTNATMPPFAITNSSFSNAYVFVVHTNGIVYFDGSGITNIQGSNIVGGLNVSNLVGTISGTNLPYLTNTIGITIDGGGLELTTGFKGYFKTDYACTIVSWTLTAEESGDIVMDIWNEPDPYDGGGILDNPPTVAETITAAAKPTLTAQQGATSSTLTGWDVDIGDSSMFGYNIDSVSTITRVTLQLKVIHQQ